MSFAEQFPVDEISHVELYARLRSFNGDVMALCNYATEGVSQQPLPMCQILAVCYQRSSECAAHVRSLINSFKLPTDCSLRLLATSVVPHTPDEELFQYIDTNPSPFFRDRMVRLLKRNKRHVVIDRLLATTKNPTNTLAELIHMASSPALGQFYWEYEARKGVDFDAIYRFHAKTFLELARKSLNDLPWQERATFWRHNIFQRIDKIVESNNVALMQGLIELLYDLPPTELLSSSDSKTTISATASLSDEFKCLAGDYRNMVLSFAKKCKFSYLFQLLTDPEREKFSGPSKLFLPVVEVLWNHLLDRQDLKAIEAKTICAFYVSKIESFANTTEPGSVAALLARTSLDSTKNTSTALTVEILQRNFWSSQFTNLTGKLSKLNVLIGDALNAIVLEKILMIWRGHFEGIKFLTSSSHALVIEEELFSAIRERMLSGIFRSLKDYDDALRARFGVIMESYAKEHSKSKHFQPLAKAYEDLYVVYNTILQDVLDLSTSASLETNFYVSFQNLIAYIVEKVAGAIRIDQYIRDEFKRSIEYGCEQVVPVEEMSSSNADIHAFMTKAQAIRNLPAFTAWMNSWKDDFAAYFINCANPVLSPTRKQVAVFEMLRRVIRTVVAKVATQHIVTADLVKFTEYLLTEIITPCQAFPPNKESTTSHRNLLELNSKVLYDLLIAIMGRFIAEKISCVRVMAGLYEVHQWKELLRSNLDTGNYAYVYPFLTKVVRDINIVYVNDNPAKPIIFTLNDFIGKDIADKIAANTHHIFDPRKDNQMVFEFITTCVSRRFFYAMMQELVVAIVNYASPKEEYKLVFDMYRQETWKKEDAQPAKVRQNFEDNLFKHLPVDHFLTTRYVKRRILTCCSTLEDKVKCYTEFLDSATTQANVFAYPNQVNPEQKDLFCLSYKFIHPMVKNVQWNAKGLRYPVNFKSMFSLYIPTMMDLCLAATSNQLKVAHSIESAQDMIALLQTVCNDKLLAEADSFSADMQNMFNSAAESAFTTYSQLLVFDAIVNEVKGQPLLRADQIQHYLALLKLWLDFFLSIKSMVALKILGRESSDSLTKMDYNFEAGYQYIRNISTYVTAGNKYLWGIERKGWKNVEKAVMVKYLSYVRSFYSQYVPKMPLSPAGLEACNHVFTQEAYEVINDFLSKYVSFGAYHQDVLDMLRVVITVVKSEEEQANRNSNTYYNNTTRLLCNLTPPYITFAARKLTFEAAHVSRPKEHDLVRTNQHDVLVFNEEEIQFLEIYRDSLIDLSEKLAVFPTAKVLALNHRIAMFRTPDKTDLQIMLDSFETITKQVCPSIIRYKFVSQLFLEHRPQFLVDVLQEEFDKEETSRLRKNAIIIKRNTRYSVPFYSRVHMCLNYEQKKFFENIFVRILLNNSSESLKDRKNASEWVTHLQTLSMDRLMALYENRLVHGIEDVPEDDEDIAMEETTVEGEEGAMDTTEESPLNPTLKRAVLLHTLTSPHADFKQALHTIFQSKYLNDTNVNLHLLNGLSRFAYFYGTAFSEEVTTCLNPENPAFTKMGVAGFKAIVRLCERLHGSSSLLVGFWDNRAKFHRDVVVCILNSLLSLYAQQGESNKEVTQALYSYAKTMTHIQTVNEIDLLQVVMSVIPGEEFIAKDWLQKYQIYRDPSSNIVLETQDTTKAFFENVLKLVMANVHQYHENTYENIIESLRLWYGFSAEHNTLLRDFYLSFVDTMVIPFVDSEVKLEACKKSFSVLTDVARVAQQVFTNKELDPSELVRASFLKYMNIVNDEANNSTMSFDAKYSYVQKIRLIQDCDVFQVRSVYDKFDKKMVTQMEEFYGAISEVYKKMSKKRRFT